MFSAKTFPHPINGLLKTLYWYDGPLIFSANLQDKHFLCYTMDMDHESKTVTYILSGATEEDVALLDENKLDLRSAMSIEPILQVETGYLDGEGWIISIEQLTPQELHNSDQIPNAGVFLHYSPDDK